MCAATKADFDRVDVGTVLAGVEPTCFTFAGALDSKARELAGAGDVEGSDVLSLLSDVCSYAMRPDKGKDPFGPRVIFGDRRTPSIEDLDTGQLAFLASIYDSIPIAEVRARIADVLFVRQRHHNFGTVALNAYLESADQLLAVDEWVTASYRYERALVIAGLALKSESDRVVGKITQQLENRRADPSYFSAKLMKALLDLRLGDPITMSSSAEAAAMLASADNDWHRAREYLLLLAQWSRKAGKTEEALRARREAAECYVQLADGVGSRSLKASYLERAIQSLRAIPGAQARIEELHQRLVAAEREGLMELKEYSNSVNLGDGPEKARALVAGVALHEAMARMAVLWRPESVARLRDAVVETAKQAVFFNAIPRALVNRNGKVMGKRGSLIMGTPEQREEALRQAMFERASQQREFLVVSLINPARAQIADEHFIGMRDLLLLTTASGFVPAGREELFALGLAAGFNGDFAVALHVLMPQFEHAIRMILDHNGTITSKIDTDGVQDERDLGWLLYCTDAKNVFGEDLLFDMQGLLVERFGGNLRNQMAHGLLDVDQMIGPQSVYFWWLTLHLVVHPLLRNSAPMPEAAPNLGNPDGTSDA